MNMALKSVLLLHEKSIGNLLYQTTIVSVIWSNEIVFKSGFISDYFIVMSETNGDNLIFMFSPLLLVEYIECIT